MGLRQNYYKDEYQKEEVWKPKSEQIICKCRIEKDFHEKEEEKEKECYCEKDCYEKEKKEKDCYCEKDCYREKDCYKKEKKEKECCCEKKCKPIHKPCPTCCPIPCWHPCYPKDCKKDDSDKKCDCYHKQPLYGDMKGGYEEKDNYQSNAYYDGEKSDKKDNRYYDDGKSGYIEDDSYYFINNGDIDPNLLFDPTFTDSAFFQK